MKCRPDPCRNGANRLSRFDNLYRQQRQTARPKFRQLHGLLGPAYALVRNPGSPHSSSPSADRANSYPCVSVCNKFALLSTLAITDGLHNSAPVPEKFLQEQNGEP